MNIKLMKEEADSFKKLRYEEAALIMGLGKIMKSNEMLWKKVIKKYKLNKDMEHTLNYNTREVKETFPKLSRRELEKI